MRRLLLRSSANRRVRVFASPHAAGGVVRLHREADDAMTAFLALGAEDPRREAAADAVEVAARALRRAVERESLLAARAANTSPPAAVARRTPKMPTLAGRRRGRSTRRRRTARVARAGDGADGPQPHCVGAVA